MPAVRSILVAIDFSDGSRVALDYAAALAHRIGAQLTVLHVAAQYVTYEPLPAFPAPAPLDPERQERLQREVRRFITPPGSEHPLGEVSIREGDPADEVLAAAAGAGVDLIVLGRHGRRGFERWILGSVAERVARKADRPVLVVPPPARPAAFDCVLCALDLSESSAEILQYAAGIARATSAGLSVLHVADDFHWHEPGASSGIDVQAVRRAVEDFARERLAGLVARTVHEGVPVNVSVLFGRAQREIERVAAESADLVVLGASSSSAVDRFFFGSTAQHVLRSSVCPVLLVRSPAPNASL